MCYIIEDKKYHFKTAFNSENGVYVRSGIIDEKGRDTGIDPFMASYPHLIDVGIMGHCIHGKTGLCSKAGIECYQSGLLVEKNNMNIEDFRLIAEQSRHKCNQFALGGRGDPEQHEHFDEILKICYVNDIVPNFTTSGYGMTDNIAEICKKYCGAVAVSWYRGEYTYAAVKMLLNAGVKTNIHFVIGKNSIDEAIERLRKNDFPRGVNAVIFLLHKPVGQGTEENVLDIGDSRVTEFFAEFDKPHSFKVGMDSCTIPAAINICRNILPESFDTCEASRYSCYIDSDMTMLPCSFDQRQKYGASLREMTIEQVWNSEEFENFRGKMRNACSSCEKRKLCMGGCPLIPKIVLCKNANINIEI